MSDDRRKVKRQTKHFVSHLLCYIVLLSTLWKVGFLTQVSAKADQMSHNF